MKRRIILALIFAPTILLGSAAGAAPEFAPNPRQSFEGFAAVNPPRAEVPVGALWINGYGPTGGGASKDNLETVRSLNSLTMDKNLQISLNVSLLDPSASIRSCATIMLRGSPTSRSCGSRM